MASNLLGEKNIHEALNIFSKAIISITIFSIISCSFVYFNIENELKHNTSMYLSIMLMFLPFFMVAMVLDYFVRIEENPNRLL